MEFFRTSVTLLSLCLFHCILAETWSMCKDNLPPVKHVSSQSNVSVPCPVLSAAEMDFKLYKGSHEVISINVRMNNTSISKNTNSPIGNFPAELSVHLDNSTYYILLGVTTNITALYTCEAVVNYPPPFKTVEHTPQTIVVVEDNQCIGCDPCQQDDLVLFVLLGVLGMYGVVMTLVAFILWIKLSQTDTSFKDRECRRKWQGVQHPTWHGFK